MEVILWQMHIFLVGPKEDSDGRVSGPQYGITVENANILIKPNQNKRKFLIKPAGEGQLHNYPQLVWFDPSVYGHFV